MGFEGMRRRYVWHNMQWVDVTDAPRRPRVGPYIITDSMRPAVHPVTGHTFDSKSAFRAVTKAHGLVELGNDAPRAPAPLPNVQADLKQDVAEAIGMLEQGYQPPPLDVADADTRIIT